MVLANGFPVLVMTFWQIKEHEGHLAMYSDAIIDRFCMGIKYSWAAAKLANRIRLLGFEVDIRQAA